MTIKIVYPDPASGEYGRGAWGSGMFNLSGTGDGPFYRSPADDTDYQSRLGYDVAAKFASGKTYRVSINKYAVWRGVVEIQKELKRRGYDIDTDGVWGPGTDAIVKKWQQSERISADGIYGQQTARTMWEPVIAQEVSHCTGFMNYLDSTVGDLVRGHICLDLVSRYSSHTYS